MNRDGSQPLKCSLGNAMIILMQIFKKYALPDNEKKTLSKGELAELLRKGNLKFN